MKVNKASRNILTLFIYLNVVRYTTMKQTSASLSFSHFSTRYHTFIVIMRLWQKLWLLLLHLFVYVFARERELLHMLCITLHPNVT